MNLYDSYSDEQLVLLLGENDEAAFTELYHRYWKLLFSVAANKLNSLTDAEEVVQEVFADLWRRRQKIVISHSIKSFLAGAAKFQVYALLDKNYRYQNRNEVLQAESVSLSHIEEEFDVKKLRERLENAVQKLPERCRLIYELSRNEGMANKEIAKTLEISEKTVENQMTKALRILREYLKFIFLLIWVH